jgi:hypothetical protein
MNNLPPIPGIVPNRHNRPGTKAAEVADGAARTLSPRVGKIGEFVSRGVASAVPRKRGETVWRLLVYLRVSVEMV